MHKLVAIMAMMTIWLLCHIIQVDEEIAMKHLFQGKRAVNRAAHAAAQQLDKEALGEGVLRLDEKEAAAAAMQYLQTNLLLDGGGSPLPGSWLREPVQVLVLEIINSEQNFPYVYVNEAYQYEVVLRKPGVVLIAGIKHPHTFRGLDPIEWTIKGTAELVAS